MNKLLILVLLMLLFQPASAYLFVVEGKLMDLGGNLIPNHPVKSLSMQAGASLQTETDSQGNYRLEFFIDGVQSIEIHVYTQGICDDDLITHRAILKSYHGTLIQDFMFCQNAASLSNCRADFIPIIAGGGHTISFFNTSAADSIVSYHWDFGDGSQSGESNPIHSFAPNNKVFITLKISTLDNCFSSKTYMINFDEDPSDEVTINLTSTTLPGGEAFFYQPLAGAGTYYFHALDVMNGQVKVPHIPQNQSFLYIIPDLQTDEPVYPTYLPTYSEGALRWQQADDWNFMNPVSGFSLLNYPEPYYGNGLIEVQVIRDDSKHLRVDSLYRLNPFSPGQDADMLYRVDSVHTPFTFLLENDDHETIAFARPNEEGKAKFNHLPSGTYFLRGEIYRINNQPIEIHLADTFPIAQNVIFTVSNDQIFVNTPDFNESVHISFYPNPATEYCIVQGLNAEFTSWYLYNVAGQLINMGLVPEQGDLFIRTKDSFEGIALFVAIGPGQRIAQKIHFLPGN